MPHCSAVSSGNGELVDVCVGDATDGDALALAVRDAGVRELVRVTDWVPTGDATASARAPTIATSVRAAIGDK